MAAIPKGKHITGAARIQPPESLSEGAKRAFLGIVSALDPSHFTPSDLPLLVAYSNAAAMNDDAQAHLDTEGVVDGSGKVSPWLAVSEKCSKVLVAVSARLRICPQSRFDRLGAGANSRPQPGLSGRKPWEYEIGDELIAGSPSFVPWEVKPAAKKATKAASRRADLDLLIAR